jgi:hypothetical protein
MARMTRASLRAFKASLPALCAALGVVAGAPEARAQSPSGDGPSVPAAEIVALRAEVAGLRAELEALRALVHELRGAPSVVMPPAIGRDEPPPVGTGALGQTAVESSSGAPVKLSGTILANTFVNSGSANWLENPNLVEAPAPGETSGSMSGTMRQSRFGLELSGVTLGGWRASGAVVADFFGGVPGFETGTVMGLTRLVDAYGRIERGDTAVQIGQAHALLAPRDPTSLAALSFPMLFRSGNLYLRAPQIRVEQGAGDALHVAIGLIAPVAGDAGGNYEFAPPAGTGERGRLPGIEARVRFGREATAAQDAWAVGLSGHVSRRRPGAADAATWAFAVDVRARSGRVGIAGEWFIAQNAEAFGGALSQPGRTTGGWVEGQFAVTGRASLNAGAGFDRPDDAEGRLARVENRSLFGNVIVSFSPQVAASLEYRWLETRAGFVPLPRRNHHLNAVFALKF